MATPPTHASALIDDLKKSGLIDADDLAALIARLEPLPESSADLTELLIREGAITKFHAKHLLNGKTKGFFLAQYKILDQLGAGGMGVVYLAEHQTLKRRVAIKVLPSARARDAEALRRFLRESRVVAALDHPNIVRAYDANREGPVHFLVMEFVPGRTLDQIVRADGPVSPPKAANYVYQTALGLHHAHEQGLVHRDIKPSNLLLDTLGTLKILDYGLARYFDAGNDQLTRDVGGCGVIGTADFIAPEQALNSSDVDIRADIYSLGMTFYTILAGETPFYADTTTQKLLSHHMKEPRPIREVSPGVPVAIASILSRMIAKKPSDRFQTPADLVDALSPWAGSPSTRKHAALTREMVEPTMASRQPTGPIPVRIATAARKPTRWRAIALAGLVCLPLIAGLVFLISGGEPNRPAPEVPTPSNAVESLETPKRSAPVAVETTPEPAGHYLPEKSPAERLRVAPDGLHFAACGRNSGEIRLIRFADKAVVKTFTGHKGTVTNCAFDESGRRLATCGNDGSVRVFDTESAKELAKFRVADAFIWGVAITPDGSKVYASGRDDRLTTWDVKTGEKIADWELPKGNGANWLTLSVKDQTIFIGGWAGRVAAIDSETGRERWGRDLAKGLNLKDVQISFVGLVPDGSALLVTGPSPRLLDPATGEDIRHLERGGVSGTVWVMAISPDGKFAAAGFSDQHRKIRVWEIATAKQVAEYDVSASGTPGLVWTPSQTRIIAASHDGWISSYPFPPLKP